MDQQPIQPVQRKSIHWLTIVICCFVCVLIVIPIGITGYQIGFQRGEQVKAIPAKVVENKKEKPKEQESSASLNGPTPFPQAKPYTLSYNSPAEWKTMIWHPDDTSTESAILSPDYTSIADPNPQTGLVILIYQFPDNFSDITQMRSSVEVVEDNLKGLTKTEVGGYSAWHATFVSTDSNRVIDDYHILKDHDHWVIRIIVPGNSLLIAQTEEQKYNYQITQLLQSIQFKTVQYQ